MKDLLILFLSFFKIGITTFGGGYAILPILKHEIVEKYKWATNEELTNYYAIGQCTPGIVSVNIATFIGYKKKGVIGGIVATLGIVCPSIIIILLIANLISDFTSIPVIQDVFSGIKICVSALIISAVFKLWKSSIIDKFTLIIFLIIFILSIVLSISPILAIIIAGILGLSIRGEKSK